MGEPRFRPGDRVKILRGPFLFDRVLIFPGSAGVVEAAAPGSGGGFVYAVCYLDRESLPHRVTDLEESELVPWAPETPA